MISEMSRESTLDELETRRRTYPFRRVPSEGTGVTSVKMTRIRKTFLSHKRSAIDTKLWRMMRRKVESVTVCRLTLNSADSHSSSGESSESRLGTGSGSLGSGSTGSSDLDVKSGDTNLSASNGDVLGSQHGGVRGGLVSISLDLHST